MTITYTDGSGNHHTFFIFVQMDHGGCSRQAQAGISLLRPNGLLLSKKQISHTHCNLLDIWRPLWESITLSETLHQLSPLTPSPWASAAWRTRNRWEIWAGPALHNPQWNLRIQSNTLQNHKVWNNMEMASNSNNKYIQLLYLYFPLQNLHVKTSDLDVCYGHNHRWWCGPLLVMNGIAHLTSSRWSGSTKRTSHPKLMAVLWGVVVWQYNTPWNWSFERWAKSYRCTGNEHGTEI